MESSLNHAKWMRLAINMAKQALPDDVPVGCLVVYKGQLVASAYNCRERDNNPCGHAEVMALAQAGRFFNNWRLNGCTVYVTLEPCPMCASLLEQARVKTVVYGASDPMQGACGSRFHLWTGDTVAGIEEQACQNLLNMFFACKRQNTGHK